MRKHLLSPFLLAISLVCYAHDGENFTASDLFASLQSSDKAALLVVHFGTTHNDIHVLTVDAINQKAKEAFKDVELRETWTPRIAMRRSKVRGVERLNPIEALKKLKIDGYTYVLVQSMNIVEGIKMESLREDVAAMKSSFKKIRISNPLLYTPKNYEAVVAAIIKNGAKEGVTLSIGHGAYIPATTQYAMLDYTLKEKRFKDYSVGAIEDYPTFDTIVTQVKTSGTKRILLVPFIFVVGDHTKNGITGDWKEELEKKDCEINVLMEGLGQNPGIQKIFIEYVRFMAKHKMVNVADKKETYAVEKD